MTHMVMAVETVTTDALAMLPKMTPMRLDQQAKPFDHPEWLFDDVGCGPCSKSHTYNYDTTGRNTRLTGRLTNGIWQAIRQHSWVLARRSQSALRTSK